MNYTGYELKVLDEIREWEEAKPGMVIQALDLIGKPISMMIENVPGSTRIIIGKAVTGFMHMLKDISYWTYTENSILKKARKAGLDVTSIHDLGDCDIEKLDELAREYFTANKIIAALEGAGCGLGGLALIAADIPALFGISFRSIQQIGSCYGFNMQDPDMLPVIMGIIHAGSGFSVAVKSSVLADMHIAAAALAGKAAYGKLAERTKTALMIEILKKSSRSLPGQIAKNISSRKLGQAIPIIGAALGAGFNYWFMSNSILAAYMLFRKLNIERRHFSVPDAPKPSLLLTIRKGIFRK
ncbi:MAG TPA: EcsC family protein [Spirochaetota bacterium]|nr:EcsC family protein [Spirochaetota bacterium]HOD15918.1 EcsC family protein [Spirochaetota bacterium]HPG52029.1 EcsC family protein [Spirochaetota bacterium]HPN11891.1 EcsC family protein [Spirochaetota bacterium]